MRRCGEASALARGECVAATVVDLCLPSLPVGRCHCRVSLSSPLRAERVSPVRIATGDARDACGPEAGGPRRNTRAGGSWCGVVVPCWPPHRRFVVRSCSARAASPLLRRAPAGVYVATCEARPACDARRTASSFVRFLLPLLTPHGGAASPPSFTRAGAAGEARDTPHCATRPRGARNRRASSSGALGLALSSSFPLPWASRSLISACVLCDARAWRAN